MSFLKGTVTTFVLRSSHFIESWNFGDVLWVADGSATFGNSVLAGAAADGLVDLSVIWAKAGMDVRINPAPMTMNNLLMGFFI